MKTVFLVLFVTTSLFAQTPPPVTTPSLAPTPEFTCSGPVSCRENTEQEMGSFLGDITRGISGEPELMPESEFKIIETKIGSKEEVDILKFDSLYSEKNNKEEAPTGVMRAFQQYRLKINTKDRNIDFINSNENKMLGHEGPESKPKDVVDVELPANTKMPLKNAKPKKLGRPESN